ncbi:unnamed protein product [Urochloa decumbens]|uniref:CWZF3/5/7 THD domain-containing protein n=1 Tax=Urochloa decumbens TaxID=240449 RepID=A0ABC8WRP4_9POAL
MPSLGGARREGVGSCGGIRLADDAEELEEGEARSDGDGEAFFDPDVALSYIDKKLQHVLGHFQKDFEGGVPAKNLGSIYGRYGSFLPTYQRSPLLHQSRSPHIAANISTSRSPYQPSAEQMDRNPFMVAIESISRNNGSGEPSSSDLLKKERCSSTNDEEVAAIYSGLGLDISSSSPIEGSPDRLGGVSPVFSKVPYESPRTILQVMTCFLVPGGFLLSPLHGNLLQLTGKVAPMLKKWETHLDMENVPRAFEGHSQSSLLPGPVIGHVAKKMKLSSKEKMHVKKTRKDKGDASVIVTKEVNTEMPACQEIISDMPASTTKVKGESQFAQGKTGNTCISRPSQQNDNIQLKEQISSNDLATDKTEVIKEQATKYTENSSFENLQTCILAQKGGPKIKVGKVDIGLEERDAYHHKFSSFDRKRKAKVKDEKKFEAAIVDCECDKNRNKEWGVGPCDDSRNVPVKQTFSSNRTGDADMARKHATELKSYHFEKNSKSHKDLDETLPNRCQGNMQRDLLEDRSAQGELRQKEKIIDTSNENESGLVTYESKKGSGTFRPLGVSFKKEKSTLNNQDSQNPVAQVVSLPMEEGKEKSCPTSVKSDPLKMKAKLTRSNIENGVQHRTAEQAISNPSDTSPMRKDGSVVTFALKEARDLKHKANDLKNKGQELKSTGLYFEAALKFLHVAFLLEIPSFDSSSSRPGHVAQSMKMYSETAKLCTFCAYEYERCKKMAAAALAYKCVEVAYLKAAYYKHPSASKDRQELQAAAQVNHHHLLLKILIT